MSISYARLLKGLTRAMSADCCRWHFYPPDIVQAIVRGVQPAHLTAKTLIQRIVLPLDWLAQRESRLPLKPPRPAGTAGQY